MSEVTTAQRGAYEGYMRLTATTERRTRSVGGTIFSDKRPRIIQLNGIDMEGPVATHMIYVVNEDKPGFIGQLGTILADASVNIASFNLGRKEAGGEAASLIEIDAPLPDKVLDQIQKLPQVREAKYVHI